jgi:hypothetical protein
MGSTVLDRIRRFYPDEDSFPDEPVAGRLNPAWKEGDRPRFAVFIHDYYPNDEPDWRYQLLVMDLKYLGDEPYPIDSIAHGNSWEAAFVCAGEYVRQALASDKNIFY